MNVVMTIDAEIFPVAPIQWVVVMIAVLVMNREKMPRRLIKLPSASTTYETMKRQ
jgi:hypothetical protein